MPAPPSTGDPIADRAIQLAQLQFQQPNRIPTDAFDHAGLGQQVIRETLARLGNRSTEVFGPKTLKVVLNNGDVSHLKSASDFVGDPMNVVENAPIQNAIFGEREKGQSGGHFFKESSIRGEKTNANDAVTARFPEEVQVAEIDVEHRQRIIEDAKEELDEYLEGVKIKFLEEEYRVAKINEKGRIVEYIKFTSFDEAKEFATKNRSDGYFIIDGKTDTETGEIEIYGSAALGAGPQKIQVGPSKDDYEEDYFTDVEYAMFAIMHEIAHSVLKYHSEYDANRIALDTVRELRKQRT